MKQKLTKEEAIDLFRQLWTDMKNELGDNPDHISRRSFKGKWCKKRFPDETILSGCPLCEYAYSEYVEAGITGHSCRFCPIDWPVSAIRRVPDCQGPQMHYLRNPISEILALPEREVPDDTNETV